LFISGKKGEKGVKKRYALINKKGELIIKGFEFVRGDWSSISKKTQYKVFEALLKDNDKEKAIKKVKEVINNLRDNKVSLKELIIRKQLTKKIDNYKSIGPHVAVAKRLIKKGYQVTAGTIISYIVTEGKGLIREKAKTIDEIKDQELRPDAEYYINNQVIPAVDRILDVLNITEEEIKNGKKQEELRKFF
jgi:DNA polymerase I